jgi:hypothetical protein
MGANALRTRAEGFQIRAASGDWKWGALNIELDIGTIRFDGPSYS